MIQVKGATQASIPLEMNIYVCLTLMPLWGMRYFLPVQDFVNFGQRKYFRQRNNAGLMMTSS